MHPVAAKLNAMRLELNQMFLEREDPIDAALLAMLCAEHVFIVGPPGTGKSLLVRTIMRAVLGARDFEIAMSKTRAVESVLGPIDIKEYRDHGHMYRKHKGFLTDAHFALLDEIGKMNPILGHDLLAILNERIRHEVNGERSAHPVPLITAFAASNEIPTDESDDAAALWDRLLFRCVVDYLRKPANFGALLTTPIGDLQTTLAFEDLQDAIRNVVPAVTLDKPMVKSIVTLRNTLAKDHVYVSDRRWRASVKALQAQAFLNGRSHIEEEDLVALRFTLWETLPQIEKVERATQGASNPFVDKVMHISDLLKDLQKGIDERKDKSQSDKAAFGKETNKKLQEVSGMITSLISEANGRTVPKLDATIDAHTRALKDVWMTCFELDEDAAEIGIQKYVIAKPERPAPTPAPAPQQPAPTQPQAQRPMAPGQRGGAPLGSTPEERAAQQSAQQAAPQAQPEPPAPQPTQPEPSPEDVVEITGTPPAPEPPKGSSATLDPATTNKSFEELVARLRADKDPRNQG